jgi:ATP-dependent RNA helicase RhlE
VSHTAVFGGAPKARQSAALRKRPTVLTATPGRLLDFIGEGQIDLSAVEVLILDEADRMLDMGFIPDVRRIAKMVENRRQTALFSATMPKPVEELASELLSDAARISVAPEALTVDTVQQSVLHLDQEHKTELLSQLIKDRGMFRVLVFTRTKHRASRVAKALFKAGIPSAEIHGNRTQNQRQAALERFRSGRVQALVGTDVAARGIDVDDITHVINFEIPNEPETYIHRIGRTARAGAEGEAISMCDAGELGDFRRIERLLREPVSVDREHQYHREPARSVSGAGGGRGKNDAGSGRRGQGRGGNRGAPPSPDRSRNGGRGRRGGNSKGGTRAGSSRGGGRPRHQSRRG